MAVSDIKVEVCVFAFDLLYLDGQPLIQRELNARREVEFLLFLSVSDLFPSLRVCRHACCPTSIDGYKFFISLVSSCMHACVFHSLH